MAKTETEELDRCYTFHCARNCMLMNVNPTAVQLSDGGDYRHAWRGGQVPGPSGGVHVVLLRDTRRELDE